MAKQVQLRRGSTAQHSTFTGVVGEVTVDTDKDTVVVHDGSTAGGFPLLKESAIGSTVQAYDATIVVDADIGSTVQAYDADTAKTDTAQTYTASQRGTVTTDNDLSFDLNATNNFSCTPTSGGTLTFTNHTSGQSGFIFLDNSAGVAITAAATTKINATDLTAISTAGVYILTYFDNGTNTYIMVSRSFA